MNEETAMSHDATSIPAESPTAGEVDEADEGAGEEAARADALADETSAEEASADEAGQPGAPQATEVADRAEAWSTGDSRVDDAVARLRDLDERDLDEHADVYDTIHSDLADVLDDASEPSRPTSQPTSES
jgi:hypothetical protein